MSDLITLTTRTASATFTKYGATLTKFIVNGTDIVLGFDDTQSYIDIGDSSPFFGCTVGRTCNRIAFGKFSLNGKDYQLVKTHGDHNLHGGPKGFDKCLFTAKTTVYPKPTVTFTYISPDGDQGFPGKLEVVVKYTLHEAPAAIQIDYCAQLIDANKKLKTVVNLTNHSYFNLTGLIEPTIASHSLEFPGRSISGLLEFDNVLIPTGKILPLSSVPEFDFSRIKPLGDGLATPAVQKYMGYDNHYAINPAVTRRSLTTEPLKMPVVARLRGGKLQMEVLTTCPGFQLYTGQHLPAVPVKTGQAGEKIQRYGGVCIETSFPPDAINRKDVGWDKGVVIGAGESWKHTTVYVVKPL